MNRRNKFVLISKSTNEQKTEGIDSKVHGRTSQTTDYKAVVGGLAMRIGFWQWY